MAQNPPPVFIKRSITKLFLIPTATAATIIAQYYYSINPSTWNHDSMRRLIESPPLVYLIFNLIVVSIFLSNTFSKRSTSSPTPAAPISEIEPISSPIATTSFPSPDHHNRSPDTATSFGDTDFEDRSRETASFSDERLIEWNPVTETASLKEERVGPGEEGGGGGGGGDSIEDTWRAIMREKEPMTRQLRKSDTWNGTSRAGHVTAGGGGGGGRLFKKSETFRDGGRRPRWWRKEEEEEEEMKEVDARAEAFISKIRGDIWLQRKESDQKFFDMINRGV